MQKLKTKKDEHAARLCKRLQACTYFKITEGANKISNCMIIHRYIKFHYFEESTLQLKCVRDETVN